MCACRLRWRRIVCLASAVLLGAVSFVAARPSQGTYPCNPRYARTADPRIVPLDGGVIDGRVDVDYECATQKERADFFLLVENTASTQPSGRTGR